MTGKTEKGSDESMDLLLDNLDDIPSLMHLVKTAPASPTRFRGLTNISHNVHQAMKSHDSSNATYSAHSKKMVWQASKVLAELSKMDDTRKIRKERSLDEIAGIAKQSLEKKSNLIGDNDDIFRNYDQCKRGIVTYDDFQQTLIARNAGLTKQETIALATALDKDRSGVLDYTDLTKGLDSLSTSTKKADSKAARASSYSQQHEESMRKRTLQTQQSEGATEYQAESTAEVGGYQRAFEYGLRCAEKRQRDLEQIAENEERYRRGVAPLDIPPAECEFDYTAHLPPKVAPDAEPSKRFYKGSGAKPEWYGDKVNDLLHVKYPKKNSKSSTFTSVRKKSTEHHHSWSDDEDMTSYTKAFMISRSQRPEHSFNKRNITGVGHLATTPVRDRKGDDVGGPTTIVTRKHKGDPASIRNRTTRAFNNSFIVDQARPVRNKKRSNSEPPGGRSTHQQDNSSLYTYLSKQVEGKETTSGGSGGKQRPESISAESKPEVDMIIMPYNQRVSENVSRALKETTPAHMSYIDTHEKKGSCKRSLIADEKTSSLQMSVNALLSQVDSHSKIKVLQSKLKRLDISNSGYVNKSEFTTALGRMGVHMTPEQIDTVFDSNAREPAGASKTSLALDISSCRRGINVKDFIQKIQARSSATALRKRRSKQTLTEKAETPIEVEDRETWKKVLDAFSDPHGSSNQALHFFRDAQVNHQNEIAPERLKEELNFIGAKLNDVEFSNILSNIKRNPHGKVDVNDFTRELHRRSAECHAVDKWTALMPSLEHTPHSASEHSKSLSKLQQQNKVPEKVKSQRKHFNSKQGEETYGNLSSHEKALQYMSLLVKPDLSRNSSPQESVPSCLTLADTQEFRKERLKWSKLRDHLVDKRNDMLKAFGGPDQVKKKLSPPEIRDRLYQAGVFLGDDDFKLLQSYAATSTSAGTKATAHGECPSTQQIEVSSIFESVGLVTEVDSRKRAVVTSSRDIDRDGGVFSSSEKSLLAHPTYRSSMLTSSLSDLKEVKGNQKRRFDPVSGLPLDKNAVGSFQMKPSEFWKFEHVGELTHITGDQRLHRNGSSVSGHKYQGTSLRQLQQQRDARKRSSSAPPGGNRGTSSSNYLWQGQREERGRNRDIPVSRFAATPLAQYMAAKNGSTLFEHSQSAQGALRTSDLVSNVESSSSFVKEEVRHTVRNVEYTEVDSQSHTSRSTVLSN